MYHAGESGYTCRAHTRGTNRDRQSNGTLAYVQQNTEHGSANVPCKRIIICGKTGMVLALQTPL